MLKHKCVSEVSPSDKNLDSMVDLAWKADRLLLMDFKVYVDVLHYIIYLYSLFQHVYSRIQYWKKCVSLFGRWRLGSLSPGRDPCEHQADHWRPGEIGHGACKENRRISNFVLNVLNVECFVIFCHRAHSPVWNLLDSFGWIPVWLCWVWFWVWQIKAWAVGLKKIAQA